MNPPDSLVRSALTATLGALLIAHPILPEIITVSGDCSLAEAITAANTDSATGACVAGAGLVVGTGDTVEQVILGEALSVTIPIAGSVTGVRLESVSCRNLTSGDAATILPAGLGASWDCSAAGIAVGAGDRIRVSARGTGD